MNPRDAAILAFAGQTWVHEGSRDSAIGARFDMSPTRYFQELRRIVLTPEAEATNPALVRRLRARMARRADHVVGRLR